ncbi:MAG TPA: GNAT family N-acetyltransferase [Rubrobacter sp.]|nr:GNAT family N-acetyltransferase [Rubrobacter sp.]
MPIDHIETQRLHMRAFQPNDWQAVYDYTSDSAVMMYIPEGPFTSEQAKTFVADNMGEQAHAVAVLLKTADMLVGHMVFHPWFAPQTYEIGWVFNSAYHGQGYATEAAVALLQYGFEALHLHRIIATCQPENVASWRVMEKLGMRREAHFRKCIRRPGNQWWDEYFYALMEEEWF